MRAPPVDLAAHMERKKMEDAWRIYADTHRRYMSKWLDSRSRLSGHKPWRDVLCTEAREEYAEGRIDLETLERRVAYALTR